MDGESARSAILQSTGLSLPERQAVPGAEYMLVAKGETERQRAVHTHTHTHEHTHTGHPGDTNSGEVDLAECLAHDTNKCIAS